jgi:gamma-glutamyltranspeptidase/glutathione hydrolase
MTPTIVLKDGAPFLVTGSPGGSRIITTVLQLIMNVVDHGMNIAEATMTPRIHHQWLPDELRVEEGISPDTARLLEALGHTVSVQSSMGSTQSIMETGDTLYGYSDTRRRGSLTIGY